MNKTLILFGIILSTNTLSCQSNNEDRQANANKEEVNITTDYHFSSLYTWNYEDKWKEDNHVAREGTFSAYYDDQTQSFLLIRESSYSYLGEMNLWVLCRPDGTFITEIIDEHGKKYLDSIKVDFHNYTKLPENFEDNTAKRPIGFVADNGENYTGLQQKLTYEGITEVSRYWLAENKVDFTPLYQFNTVLKNLWEVHLPIDFPLATPGNQLLIKEESSNPLAVMKRVDLMNIESVDYHLNY